METYTFTIAPGGVCNSMATRVGVAGLLPVASLSCAMWMTCFSASSKSLFELSRMLTSGAVLDAPFALVLASRSERFRSVFIVVLLSSRSVPTLAALVALTLFAVLFAGLG